jgi:uncharacterized protein YndB with AHSA1/START domain
MAATANKSNEIKLYRVFDAPLKMVWEAWTDEKQVGQWWGPRGFTITTHSKDLRVGGMWHYTMHGPDGVDYINKTRYFEFEPYTKMVYDHGGNDERKPMFRVTVLFKEVAGKTHLDMTMAFDSAEAAENSRVFIKKAGGNSTWDRLAEYLEKETSNKEVFVINRTFDAPIDLMFEMWTKPEHFAKWMGPTGSAMRIIEGDIKAGGGVFYEMTNAGGPTMYGKTQYREITKPNRLVYSQQFCDEKGNVSRHPMAPTWPETMLTTVLLAPEGPGQTRLTVTWEVTGKATPEEMEMFVKSRAGMTGGWTGSFDRLEDYLVKR